MSKQAVKVIIRTRPTDEFANKNISINSEGGVSNLINFSLFIQKFEVQIDKKD
jgi:hypothetical protein